jgi:hypothetical protein
LTARGSARLALLPKQMRRIECIGFRARPKSACRRLSTSGSWHGVIVTSLNRHFKELLKSFNSAGVRYLVLGGYAVNYHGYHRNTKDIDIWIAVSGDNPARTSEALQAFGFAATAVPPEHFVMKGRIHTVATVIHLQADDLCSPSIRTDVQAYCSGRRRCFTDNRSSVSLSFHQVELAVDHFFRRSCHLVSRGVSQWVIDFTSG